MFCILCLEKAKSSIPGEKFIDIFSEEGLRLNISSIIDKHFWLKPKRNCASIQQVCRNCWHIIRDFHALYERVVEAHHQLESKTVVVDDLLPHELKLKSERIPCNGERIKLANNLADNLFDTEVKVEVNDLDLLPQIEIIEEIPNLSERSLRASRRNRQQMHDILSDKEMCNKRIKRELSIELDIEPSHDIFADTDIPATESAKTDNDSVINNSLNITVDDNVQNANVVVKKRGRPRKTDADKAKVKLSATAAKGNTKKSELLEEKSIKNELLDTFVEEDQTSIPIPLEENIKLEQKPEKEDKDYLSNNLVCNDDYENFVNDDDSEDSSQSTSDTENDTDASWPEEKPNDKYAIIYRKVAVKPKKYRKHPKPLVPPKRMSREEIEARNAQQAEYDTVIAKFYDNMRCPKCQLLVRCFGDMRAHFRISHNDDHGFVECCGRRFITRKTLAEHVYVHWNPDHFKCSSCNKTCLDSKQLETHENTHLPNPRPSKYKKTFQCDKCPKTFSSKASFEHHSFAKHVPKEEFKFECPECKKKLPTDRKLQQHLKNDHDPQKLFICDKCGKIFKNSYNLKKHNDMEHTERKLTPEPQQCKLCGTWYRHLAGLKTHMKNIHENTSNEHRCHICNKVSTTERALKRHIYLNHKCDRKFKCSMCAKAFKRGQDLREHISVHTGEALYTCPNCPMTFASSANMYKHRQRLHKTEYEADRQQAIPPNIIKQAKTGTSKVRSFGVSNAAPNFAPPTCENPQIVIN
uniref:Transcription factor grauzone n=1 Tax=Glossina austeni TaxID=7395 RepID=A0A1A9V1Y8_GLOAU